MPGSRIRVGLTWQVRAEQHRRQARPRGSRARKVPPAPRPCCVGRLGMVGCGTVLLAFLLRISLSHGMNSDAANNALQGWDILHGNFLLHGWIIGDATYYTLEVPLYAITEALTFLRHPDLSRGLRAHVPGRRGLRRRPRHGGQPRSVQGGPVPHRDRRHGIAAAHPSGRDAPARSA